MWSNPQETADLITFIEEILNGKLYFLYSVTGMPETSFIQVQNFFFNCWFINIMKTKSTQIFKSIFIIMILGWLLYLAVTFDSGSLISLQQYQLLDLSIRSQTCNFNEKETLAQVFSCEFCKISKNTCCYRTPSLTASVIFSMI